MKKENKVWAFTLLALWSLSPNNTQAQQDSVRTLDEVIISAARIEQPVIDAPRSVSVITRERILQSPYNSVGELLSTEAGVYLVGATQTPGTNQSVFLRGANSNQVVVLIDGLRVTDPSSPNGTIDFSEISLTGVEKIEIIRGAHSTLYGGSAVGGAINIITRKAATEGFHGNASIQPGYFSNGGLSLQSNLQLEYKLKSGWYVQGGLYAQRVRGLNATIDTTETSAQYKTSDEDDFTKVDFSAKAGFKDQRWDVFLSGRRSTQHAEIDAASYKDDDNAYLDFDRDIFEYHIDYKLTPRWTVLATGSLSPSKRYLQNDSSIVDFDGTYDKTFIENTYNGETITNEVVVTHNGNKVRGIAGAGQYREEMDFQTHYYSNAFGFPFVSDVNYDSIETTANTKYIFAQGSYDISKFNIKGGARLSNHSRFGNFWTFEVNPSYKIQNALIYGSVSTGYNAPTLYQLFDPTRNAGSPVSRGNNNLKPEKSLSLEVGLKKEYNNGSYFTVSAFSSTVRNTIEYVYLWNKETAVEDLSFMDYVNDLYLNVSKQEIIGGELTGHVVIGKFYVHGNVTRLSGKVTINPGDINMQQTAGHHVQLYNYGSFATEGITVSSLARRPRLTGLFEVGFKPTEALTLATSIRHAGARNDVEYNAGLGPFGALDANKVNRYNLLDFSARYTLSKNVSIAVKGENFLDENYSEIYGFRTRGRSFYVKAAFTW